MCITQCDILSLPSLTMSISLQVKSNFLQSFPHLPRSIESGIIYEWLRNVSAAELKKKKKGGPFLAQMWHGPISFIKIGIFNCIIRLWLHLWTDLLSREEILFWQECLSFFFPYCIIGPKKKSLKQTHFSRPWSFTIFSKLDLLEDFLCFVLPT